MLQKLYHIISIVLVFLLGFVAISCRNASPEKSSEKLIQSSIDTVSKKEVNKKKEYKLVKRKDWVELHSIDSGFVYDLRYATTQNFVHKKMYPCAKCYVRPELAKALLQIQKELQTKGYRLKLFDCYRPGKVQKELWKIVPDPRYVANPNKGSMHNRGVAVDLTIVDTNGKELDMGTSFDYFGKKAYHAYKNLPVRVLKNRLLLKNIMQKYGLQPITSEWWHYSYRKKSYPIEQWVWNCNEL